MSSCSLGLQRTPEVPPRQFHKLDGSPVYGHDPENPMTLREYQVVGLNWLLFNWCVRAACNAWLWW